jgi:transposase-like protein
MLFEKIKGHINERAPATAYAGGRAIRLAPLGCPYCGRELRAQDVEQFEDGDARIVCPGCHRDLLTIESK